MVGDLTIVHWLHFDDHNLTFIYLNKTTWNWSIDYHHRVTKPCPAVNLKCFLFQITFPLARKKDIFQRSSFNSVRSSHSKMQLTWILLLLTPVCCGLDVSLKSLGLWNLTPRFAGRCMWRWGLWEATRIRRGWKAQHTWKKEWLDGNLKRHLGCQLPSSPPAVH